MSKVITFSRTFPAYHPKAGEPTRFIEKVYAGLADILPEFEIPNAANDHWDWHEYYNCSKPKFHTIRAGDRWKVGDKFSPRVWSGKPYNSKQIIIAPDIEIKKIWEFEIENKGNHITYYLDGLDIFQYYPKENAHVNSDTFHDLAKNDGLTQNDIVNWFGFKPFIGQIICWNENVEYS